MGHATMTIELEIDGKRVKLSRVKSIVAAGEKHVFDLEVAGVHNYFANGVNVHNCEYHALLDHYGTRYGEEIYKFMDSFVHYRHRKLLVHPSGPNKRTLRGRTRLLTAAIIHASHSVVAHPNKIFRLDYILVNQVGTTLQRNSGSQRS